MSPSNKVSQYSKDVAHDLLKIGAVELNVSSPFTWVSGIKSPVYCDNRKIYSHIEVRNRVVDAFCELIKSSFKDVEIIAGIATGGIPIGTLIADRLKLPFIYVRQTRKEHGLMRQVEGAYKKGEKVVLIEDHISTGGSSMRAIQGLREEGLEILALVSIMTYRFQKARDVFEKESINHISICDLDIILETAVEIGNISTSDKNSILEFRDSPSDWAK